MRHNAECPKCKEVRKSLTKHHLLPCCHFGRNGPIAYICRTCHDDLEYFLQRIEGRTKKGKRNKLPKCSYFTIYEIFISL